MRMRWIPLDPWWLILTFLASIAGAAFVIGNEGSDLLVVAIAGPGIASTALGMDRWLERHHPQRRNPQH
jgi:hypothetical protein